MVQVSCGKCGTTIDEPSFLQPDERPPCPSCGEKSRTFHVKIEENIRPYGRLGVKARHGPAGRPFYEAVSGHDRHRRSGRMMKLERIIDREKDQYKEVVIDPETGQIIHQCEEPLSKHRGHGTAKGGSSGPSKTGE